MLSEYLFFERFDGLVCFLTRIKIIFLIIIFSQNFNDSVAVAKLYYLLAEISLFDLKHNDAINYAINAQVLIFFYVFKLLANAQSS